MAHDTIPAGSAFDKSGKRRRPENLSTLDEKLNKLPANRRAKIEQRAAELIEANGAVTFEIWFRSDIHEQADAVLEDVQSLNSARRAASENIQQHGFRIGQIIGYDQDGERVYEEIARRGKVEVKFGE